MHLGLLGKFKDAGLKAVASPEEISEVNALINYEDISGEVGEIIERIRVSLNSGIKSGKVHIGRRQKIDVNQNKSIQEHPTFDITTLAHGCDFAIIDDRCINKHEDINSGDNQVMLLSTLDLIDVLVSHSVISDDERLEYRTKLRRAGYFFVPVGEEEFKQCLMKSGVVDGHVSETAELKAIRENILFVRMNNWLQLPEEAEWLDLTHNVFIQVLKDLWTDSVNLPDTRARSDWILDQIDIRGWAHSFEPEIGDSVIRTERGAHIIQFISPNKPSEKMSDAYLNWVEDKIIVPIKEQFPDLYSWIVKKNRMVFAKIVEDEVGKAKKDTSDIPYLKVAAASLMLKIMPPILLNTFLEERDFCEEYGLIRYSSITIGDSCISFQLSALSDAIRKILSGVTECRISDSEGQEWKITNKAENDDLPNLVICAHDRELVLPDLAVLSPDSAIRIRSLNQMASNVNLYAESQDIWSKILSERALEDEEVDQLHCDLRDTPSYVAHCIRKEIESGQVKLSFSCPDF